MQYRTIHLATFLGIMLSLAFTPGLADAKKGSKGGHKDYEHSERHYGDNDDDFNLDVNIHIGGGDRELISEYIRNDVRRNCPPGLARKTRPASRPVRQRNGAKVIPFPMMSCSFPSQEIYAQIFHRCRAAIITCMSIKTCC